MMAPVNNDSTSPVVPPSIKPTSRARTYRIPNTSEAGALTGNYSSNAGGVANTDDNNNANESFLWATREIAALDFLMNVPLGSEKDIVRAGLSGGRWNRHQHTKHHDQPPPTAGTETEGNELDFSTIEEEGKQLAVGHATNNTVRSLSNFDIIPRNSEDEGGRLSDAATALTGTESSIIHTSHHTDMAGGGSWWDRLVRNDKRFFSAANQQARRREQLELEEKELERPTESPSFAMMNSSGGGNAGGNNGVSFADNNIALTSTPNSRTSAGVPGRRLDGRDAITITVPEEFRARPNPSRTVARKAAVREWEIRVAYGGGGSHSNSTPRKALLDGRCFFATKKSYPVAVFSTIKYEPKKEETLRRRRMLEEMGGGGTHFVLPERDWRGISYRALLPQDNKQHDKALAFNRLLGSNTSPTEKMKRRRKKKKSSSPYDNTSSSSDEDNNDTSSVSSSGSEDPGYPLGFLDDPEMRFGRNKNVLMGDKITGPMISSTIQFVKPRALKADLNKQFRERFDQWEPHKSRRKYIGAKIIDGVYTLIDPTEKEDIHDFDTHGGRATEREREKIRMPPSLTLSKIRSLKQQALVACIRGRIEISTLALACIYFERLCLDCRVDKTNRRLSFAACLLLAAKVNESNSVIAYDRGTEQTKSVGSELPLMTSWVKPNKKSGKIFESLVAFFTHDWSLSLKQLYNAEWIVFSALGFSLKAKPSEVEFHFKRLLRRLEWNPRSYLGPEMYRQWQQSLIDEAHENERRQARHKRREERNERKLLKLQRKLHMMQQKEELKRRSTVSESSQEDHAHFRRRHSLDFVVGQGPAVSLQSSTAHSEKESSVDGSPGGRATPKRGERAVRGILSRFRKAGAPPRHSDFGLVHASHGQDLDKLSPKEPEKKVATMKQSVSFPNLSSLNSNRNDDVVIDFSGIREVESEHSDHSIRHEGEEGLFV